MDVESSSDQLGREKYGVFELLNQLSMSIQAVTNVFDFDNTKRSGMS